MKEPTRRSLDHILFSLRWLLGLALLPFLLPTSARSVDFQECWNCHDRNLLADAALSRQHTPFREKLCGDCHLAKEPDDPAAGNSKEERKVHWLGEATFTATEHAFFLTGETARETLVVDGITIEGVKSSHEFDLPAISGLSEIQDSGSAPTISGVEVIEIRQGLFLTATIGWQTDTLTDAQIRYGVDDLSLESKPSHRFGRSHQVVLRNLQADTTYQFQVVSRDLFGRSRNSDIKTFSTTGTPPAERKEGSTLAALNGDELEVVAQFQRIGGDFIVVLQPSHPAKLFVGVRGKLRNPPVSQESEPALEEDAFHAGLSSPFEISYIACLNCHSPHLHPVNVVSQKPGIRIPEQFPTLPDGRITCSSCHAPHSSNAPFFLRAPSKQDLCSGCHQKWVRDKAGSK